MLVYSAHLCGSEDLPRRSSIARHAPPSRLQDPRYAPPASRAVFSRQSRYKRRRKLRFIEIDPGLRPKLRGQLHQNPIFTRGLYLAIGYRVYMSNARIRRPYTGRGGAGLRVCTVLGEGGQELECLPCL